MSKIELLKEILNNENKKTSNCCKKIFDLLDNNYYEIIEKISNINYEQYSYKKIEKFKKSLEFFLSESQLYNITKKEILLEFENENLKDEILEKVFKLENLKTSIPIKNITEENAGIIILNKNNGINEITNEKELKKCLINTDSFFKHIINQIYVYQTESEYENIVFSQNGNTLEDAKIIFIDNICLKYKINENTHIVICDIKNISKIKKFLNENNISYSGISLYENGKIKYLEKINLSEFIKIKTGSKIKKISYELMNIYKKYIDELNICINEIKDENNEIKNFSLDLEENSYDYIELDINKEYLNLEKVKENLKENRKKVLKEIIEIIGKIESINEKDKIIMVNEIKSIKDWN